MTCPYPEGGGRRQGVRTPLENHKAIGLNINTGLDLMDNHKATKAEFNVGQSSARQAFK